MYVYVCLCVCLCPSVCVSALCERERVDESVPHIRVLISCLSLSRTFSFSLSLSPSFALSMAAAVVNGTERRLSEVHDFVDTAKTTYIDPVIQALSALQGRFTGTVAGYIAAYEQYRHGTVNR
jgi:hypothetical protein